MFSNIYGTSVSDNQVGTFCWLWSFKSSYVDNSGGLYIGYLVKLNMEARHAGRRGQLPEVMISKYLKAQCPLPISIVSNDGVADMNHVPVISTIDGSCENLSLGSAASCASLDHLDGNGGPYSLSKEN